MAEFSAAPAAIEGAAVLITGQDIRPGPLPHRLRENNMIVYTVEVKRRGEAIITEECPNRDARVPIRAYSNLKKGSKITGPNLWGFVSFPLSPGDIKVGDKGRTSAHPGQELHATDGCFMEIVSGWRGLPLNVHPKDVLTG